MRAKICPICALSASAKQLFFQYRVGAPIVLLPSSVIPNDFIIDINAPHG